jgi:hypothetical protein
MEHKQNALLHRSILQVENFYEKRLRSVGTFCEGYTFFFFLVMMIRINEMKTENKTSKKKLLKRQPQLGLHSLLNQN